MTVYTHYTYDMRRLLTIYPQPYPQLILIFQTRALFERSLLGLIFILTDDCRAKSASWNFWAGDRRTMAES